jgi:hypothetical protein
MTALPSWLYHSLKTPKYYHLGKYVWIYEFWGTYSDHSSYLGGNFLFFINPTGSNKDKSNTWLNLKKWTSLKEIVNIVVKKRLVLVTEGHDLQMICELNRSKMDEKNPYSLSWLNGRVSGVFWSRTIFCAQPPSHYLMIPGISPLKFFHLL